MGRFVQMATTNFNLGITLQSYIFFKSQQRRFSLELAALPPKSRADQDLVWASLLLGVMDWHSYNFYFINNDMETFIFMVVLVWACLWSYQKGRLRVKHDERRHSRKYAYFFWMLLDLNHRVGRIWRGSWIYNGFNCTLVRILRCRVWSDVYRRQLMDEHNKERENLRAQCV